MNTYCKFTTFLLGILCKRTHKRYFIASEFFIGVCFSQEVFDIPFYEGICHHYKSRLIGIVVFLNFDVIWIDSDIVSSLLSDYLIVSSEHFRHGKLDFCIVWCIVSDNQNFQFNNISLIPNIVLNYRMFITSIPSR